jgi:2-dehydropantoate 2-reductase
VKTVIAGAGAIGAYIGARMAHAGQEVVLFARGPHFRAMKDNGVRVREADSEFVVRPQVVDDLERAGKADVVILGVKAHSLPALAPRLQPLIGKDTVFVSTQNGIPWWYFQRHGGEFEGIRIERVDPGGAISSVIEAGRVVASIVYFSTEVIEPGVVRHIEGNRISLGEPDGTRSDRIRSLADILIQAGLRAPITTRIRHEIWVKILGNMSFNPISALTGATLVRMAQDPDLSVLIRHMMEEAEAIATKLGVELPVSIDQRIAGAEKVGEHKTSMLQDLEAGRPLEIEAVVGAVLELGERFDIPMPHTHAVYACTKLLANHRTRKMMTPAFNGIEHSHKEERS